MIHSSDPPVVAIVDDEVDITTFLQVGLEDEGFEVVTVSDAAEAIGRLELRPPDIVCLDLVMPGQSGMTLYERLARHDTLKECPVVIISGLNLSGELSMILSRAGDLPAPAAFLEKPIDLAELTRLINTLLRRPVGVAP